MARAPEEKTTLHPRNRHRSRYDFPALIQAEPALARFVAPNPYGDLSVDFADPDAVKALNGAILKHFYGVSGWSIPPGYLCPPIPGRADYVHHVADLLAGEHDGAVPRGPAVRVLDVGVGANVVYPLIGHAEYGWSFVGSDIDPVALDQAGRTLQANPGFAKAIGLRLQVVKSQLLAGLLKADESFDAVMCNPPFHASAQEARAGSQRKWKNLGRAAPGDAPVLNFGGQGGELWCPGGEAAFIDQLIRESGALPGRVLWFSSLVSKEETMHGVRRALKAARVAGSLTIDLAQGQKKSRVVAWTFLPAAQRRAWAKARWGVSGR